MGLRGEELTVFGLNFLVDVNSFLQKSISDEVLVCGGGNVAMDVAGTAKRLSAGHLPGAGAGDAGLPGGGSSGQGEGIELHCGWGLKSVVTDEDGNVTGLESKRCMQAGRRQRA